ncbi:MAG: hypothetical protein WEB30_17380 [Cyclobacteriaceae bacterium]
MTTGKITAWVVCLMVASLMPASGQDVSVSTSHESSTSTNGKQTYRWSRSGVMTDFTIELRGKIELTDDDKDIKSISNDGYLEISKTVFGSKRSIVIESLGDGKVKKEYYEGRSKMPWEPNGKTWLAEILPEVVRSSTIGAESRVNRFFKKGGARAVLAEIENLKSDHVAAHYANLLMNRPVPPNDYALIIGGVSGKVDSDHYIAAFLQKHAGKFMQQKGATTAFFNATKKMDSDHYKTNVISSALKDYQGPSENLKIALQTAAEMDSDHYITEVLTALLKQSNLTDDTLTELINTTKAVESDHYRTVVLTRALDRPGLSDASHKRLLESVKGMSSDHYITQVIQHLMDNKLSANAMTDLMGVLSSIGSDHYRTEVLTKIIERQDLGEEHFTKVLSACGDMSSDHYKTVVLIKVMSKNVSQNALLQVLNSTDEINSDHYVTEVLLSAAPRVKNGNDAIKNAYRQSAKNISSETYYGRALRAIE